MPSRRLSLRIPLLSMSTALALVAVGCGDSGGEADADATPAPISSPAELDSFRFAIEMDIASSGAPTGSPGISTDTNLTVSASGAVVAPDRSQATITADLGFLDVDLETITVGEQTWTRAPGGEWTEGGEADPFGVGDLGLNPATILTEDEEAIAELQSVVDSLEGTRESVNDRSAIRYDLTEEQMREMAEDPEFAEMFAGFEEMGDADLAMSMWFDIATGVPLRLTIEGTGTQEGIEGTANVEFDITDLNSDITIEPPA